MVLSPVFRQYAIDIRNQAGMYRGGGGAGGGAGFGGGGRGGEGGFGGAGNADACCAIM